jgi:hypothetical protein
MTDDITIPFLDGSQYNSTKEDRKSQKTRHFSSASERAKHDNDSICTVNKKKTFPSSFLSHLNLF